MQFLNLRPSSLKVWLKGHTRSKDGCAAWKSFTTHYLASALKLVFEILQDAISEFEAVKLEGMA
jgi:hypothetical protein